MGDSRTAFGGWQGPLAAELTTSTGARWEYYNGGAGQLTVATTAAGISELLAAINPTEPVMTVTINLGVVEMLYGTIPAEATWVANYQTILDAVHAKWPLATVGLMRPWAQGYDTDANTIAGWVGTVQASRSSFAILGPDERVWLKGADNGAAMTTDGVHYSTAGKAECAAQWKTALGY